VGISDHSKSAFYANGLTEQRIYAQHEEIDRLNQKFVPFRIFKGIESDILPDGKLDYTDDILALFDFVIASVHSQFTLSQEAMTTRICHALAHPAVTMLGHPTGRLLLAREAYAVNIQKVIETAAEYDKIIEINANPYRLDLDWRDGRYAKKLGVKTSINPDAHALEGLADYQYGLGIARKAWFESTDILNACNLTTVTALFKKK
jgi:DNA polymerase (family 10)